MVGLLAPVCLCCSGWLRGYQASAVGWFIHVGGLLHAVGLLEATLLPGEALVRVLRSLQFESVAGPLVPIVRRLVACWLPGFSVGQANPAPGAPASVDSGEVPRRLIWAGRAGSSPAVLGHS